LAFWRGDLEHTAHYAQLGLDFAQEMNYYGDKSACQVVLSYVYSMAEDYAAAYDLCQLANQDELFNVTVVMVQWGLALASVGLGDNVTAWVSLRECLQVAYGELNSPVYQVVCLPIGAALLSAREQPEPAAELLGFAEAQPAAISGWMQQWPLLDILRQNLESQLGRSAFEAALARGAAGDVVTQVQRLIAEADRV
jgi:hypothetical protein